MLRPGIESEGSWAITGEELVTLDRAVNEALASGDESGLRVLGYGEITLVLGWPTGAPASACKRLPVFPTPDRFEAFSSTFGSYLSGLRSGGIDVIPTELRTVEQAAGIAAYVVQPAYPSDLLAVKILGAADPQAGHPMVRAIVDAVAVIVTPRFGFDGQLSNWLWDNGRLRYFDVTTPMMWDEAGACLLDVGLLVRALPWALRAPVRRFVVPGILDRYRDLRLVLLDLCSNLIKERLDAWLPAFFEAANEHVDPPITEQECRRDYRSDARLWEAILRVRRLDRAWQLRVRRRAYPFLLPKEITR